MVAKYDYDFRPTYEHLKRVAGWRFYHAPVLAIAALPDGRLWEPWVETLAYEIEKYGETPNKVVVAEYNSEPVILSDGDGYLDALELLGRKIVDDDWRVLIEHTKHDLAPRQHPDRIACRLNFRDPQYHRKPLREEIRDVIGWVLKLHPKLVGPGNRLRLGGVTKHRCQGPRVPGINCSN